MNDKRMTSAVERFITQRVNDCGSHKNDAVQSALEDFSAGVKKLKATLSPEQKAIFTKCENTYSLVDGETMHCYYRAGFSDAVLFLLGWRDGEWN